jgi:hypothetical protein
VKNIKLALIFSNKQAATSGAIAVTNKKNHVEQSKINLLYLFLLTVFLQWTQNLAPSLEIKYKIQLFPKKKQSDSLTVTLGLHNCSLRNFLALKCSSIFTYPPWLGLLWCPYKEWERARERERERKASCRVLILANSENLSFSVPNNSRSAHPACKKNNLI